MSHYKSSGFIDVLILIAGLMGFIAVNIMHPSIDIRIPTVSSREIERPIIRFDRATGIQPCIQIANATN